MQAALTFTELVNWLEEEEINLVECPKESFDGEGGYDVARLFPLEGGMLKTCDILARKLGTSVRLISKGEGLHSPPIYAMEGADLVTEGAIALNQTANLLYSKPDEVTGNTAPEQLARLLFNSDVVDVYEGLAANEAHQVLRFKQLGIRLRREALGAIMNRLENLGKMVHYYPF